ncbi:MAG: hypothetical protein A3F54_05150 [Candidatus Kerfeldbacteria bacterium RIFCSPHIGHO2_12_FULL_48_17]|uniref:Transcription regulator TrmB N-terminal domain-containing protein n=1 Tax=Candidatus Kerfeldbacteria bacterium RIFCSPHIGHO2_12_FULL_48_17 TaxID=1798542 RepID=A0A1G2B3J7_9BACT|nr:MAG: hypothetical protein A3F54_05150 [Candidatus Kerfeldbacteria bacterium RIFCSPHIGHO2_12_FULL_48_17]
MLSKALVQLGLSEKEALVYLAALELGQTSVQKISEKAGINRATTYFVMESLMNLGLASTVEKGKKTLFAAEPPEHLVNLLKKQEAEIVQKAKNFEGVLPELKSLFNLEMSKPKVRFYEGKESLRVLREDLLETAANETIEDIYYEGDIDDVMVTPRERKEYLANRLKKNISVVSIGTKNGLDDYETLKTEHTKNLHHLVPVAKHPISSDISIYGKKISMISPKKHFASVIIEDADIAGTLRTIFYLAIEGIKALSKEDKEKKGQGGIWRNVKRK